MNLSDKHLEWIGDLIRTLHEARYTVTTDDCKKVAFVVSKFLNSTDEVSLLDHEHRIHLRDMLCPIVSCTASQQGTFDAIFEEVFNRNFQKEPVSRSAHGLKDEQNTKVGIPPDRKRAVVSFVLVLLATIVTVLIITNVIPINTTPENNVNGPIADTINANTEHPDNKAEVTNSFNKETYHPEYRKEFSLLPEKDVVYTLNRELAIGFATIISLILGRLAYRIILAQRKANRVTSGPYQLVLPSGEHHIQASGDFDSLSKLLQQRDQGNHHLLDVSSSIQATIRKAGFPVINFKRYKQRPHYLVLIDTRSPYNQQTKLYTYLTSLLHRSGIDIDVFYFHTSPDLCWNQKNQQGIKTELLHRRFPSSYLILITEGIKLVDDNRQVAAWILQLFNSWGRRAIMTPRPVHEWGFVEKTLSTFFRVLPITPAGMALLRPLMDADHPSFSRLKSELERNSTRSVFPEEVNTEEITADEVQAHIELYTKSLNSSKLMALYLKQWALATSVAIKPALEFTLAIGRAIEKKKKITGLVSTNHLLIITDLPWLKQERIPLTLRDRLLERLNKNDVALKRGDRVEFIARQAVFEVYQNSSAISGSKAHQEKEIGMFEQDFLSDQTYPGKRHSISKLRSFAKSGLIYDSRVKNRLQRHYWKLKLMILALFYAAIIIPTSIMAPKLRVTNPPQVLLRSAYYTPADTIDSATYYNNAAEQQYKNMFDDSTKFTGNYAEVLKNLVASATIKPTHEVVTNASNLHYNAAVLYFTSDINSTRRILSDVPEIMKPFHALDDKWVPDNVVIKKYLKMLSHNPDSIPEFIITQVPSGTRKRLYPQITKQMIESSRNAFTRNQLSFAGIPFLTMNDGPIIVNIPDPLFTDLEDFITDLTVDKIYCYYKGENPANFEMPDLAYTSSNNRRRPTTASSSRKSTIPQRRTQSRTTDPPAIQDPDTLASKTILIDTTRIENKINDTITSEANKNGDRELLYNYGVLKGELRSVTMNRGRMINLIISAGNTEFGVTIQTENYLGPIIKLTTEIPSAHIYIEKLPPGFTRLAHDPGSGALNYIHEQVNRINNTVNIDALYKELKSLPWIERSRVYVWGSANLNNNEKSPSRIGNVHMNQGATREDFYARNGPWQDGAILFESAIRSKKGAPETLSLYIYFQFNEFIVDDKGNPIAPRKK